MKTSQLMPGLLAFVETARAGSLTAAAQRLDLTPAAVSKSLGKLEASLGVRLVARSTRQLRLTTEGERFLAQAAGALRDLDAAVADVAQGAREATGRVRISVGHAFGRRWVLPALPALSRAHPGLVVEVDLDNQPVDLVANGYDIGIRGGLVEDSSLVARRVCQLPAVLVASAAYLRRHGHPATPEDLAAHACLGFKRPGGTAPVWRFRAPGAARRPGKLIEWSPALRLAVSDPEAVLDLALGDAGIVQTGLHHALPYLRSGRLRLVLPDWHHSGEREVVLHYPHRQYLAPRVRVVVDALLAHFAASSDLHVTPAQLRASLPAR